MKKHGFIPSPSSGGITTTLAGKIILHSMSALKVWREAPKAPSAPVSPGMALARCREERQNL